MTGESSWASDIEAVTRALDSRSVPILFGDGQAHYAIARHICDQRSLHLVPKLVVNLDSLIGTPKNSISYELSALHQCIQSGGMVFLSAEDYSDQTVAALLLLEPFLPRGNYWRIPDYLAFNTIEPSRSFFLVLSLPAGAEGALPQSLATRLAPIQTRSRPLSVDKTRSPPEPDIGPGCVLILMKFGMPQYERWYEQVVCPVVKRYGTPIRLTMELADWQSTLAISARNADVVVVDLSYDLRVGVSPNVLWEVNTIWNNLWRKNYGNSYQTERLLFYSRYLDSIHSISGDDNFVYATELPHDMLADVPDSGHTVEELIGFKIRKLREDDADAATSFQNWLDAELRPWVQTVRPPESFLNLRRTAQECVDKSEAGSIERRWWTAILNRDFGVCSDLLASGEPSDEIRSTLGAMIASIGVANSFGVNGYWHLAKAALRRPGPLQPYFIELLGSKYLLQSRPMTTHFRENLWFALLSAVRGSDAWVPSQIEYNSLLAASELEPHAAIREVAMTLLIELAPANIRDEAMFKYLLEPEAIFHFLRNR